MTDHPNTDAPSLDDVLVCADCGAVGGLRRDLVVVGRPGFPRTAHVDGALKACMCGHRAWTVQRLPP